jgi:hypothetical protein
MSKTKKKSIIPQLISLTFVGLLGLALSTIEKSDFEPQIKYPMILFISLFMVVFIYAYIKIGDRDS